MRSEVLASVVVGPYNSLRWWVTDSCGVRGHFVVGRRTCTTSRFRIWYMWRASLCLVQHASFYLHMYSSYFCCNSAVLLLSTTTTVVLLLFVLLYLYRLWMWSWLCLHNQSIREIWNTAWPRMVVSLTTSPILSSLLYPMSDAFRKWRYITHDNRSLWLHQHQSTCEILQVCDTRRTRQQQCTSSSIIQQQYRVQYFSK